MLSSPQGTEMFQFPWFPLLVLCVQTRVTPHDRCRVSPFGYPRIEAWSAAPRGFSQPPTSFFGFRRQGIHRWLFVAWRTKMLVLAMQFSRCVDMWAPRRHFRRVETARLVGLHPKVPAVRLCVLPSFVSAHCMFIDDRNHRPHQTRSVYIL